MLDDVRPVRKERLDHLGHFCHRDELQGNDLDGVFFFILHPARISPCRGPGIEFLGISEGDDFIDDPLLDGRGAVHFQDRLEDGENILLRDLPGRTDVDHPFNPRVDDVVEVHHLGHHPDDLVDVRVVEIQHESRKARGIHRSGSAHG